MLSDMISEAFFESSTIDKTILWTVVVNLIFFRVFRTYSNVLRFSSFVDIMRIFVSLTVSYALLMITSVLTESYLEFNLVRSACCSCPISSALP